MKFSTKKMLFLSNSIVMVAPAAIVVSCSNSSSNEFNASASPDIYSQIWNLSTDNFIKNTIFDMTISQLEEQINNSIKSNSRNTLIMKTYSFYLLWRAIKYPNTNTGGTQTNLSNDLQNYSSFLSDILVADNEEEIDKYKTFNKFKNYINTYDFKISILNFETDPSSKNTIINKNIKLRDVLANGQYVLNFKIDFWTTDKDTNEKMISPSSGKSIMYKNSLSREERGTIKKIKNQEIKEMVTNQFNYQSTKLFFDISTNKFSTIILPSNINYNSTEETPNSGYTSSDKQRKLFMFDWTAPSNTSTRFETNLNIMLNDSAYFDTTVTTNFKLFLEWSGIMKNSNMETLKINLGKSIYYDAKDYE